jgi:hypothetical protein
VPADAFKQFTLFSGQPDQIAKTFRSSGTTDPRNSSKSHFSAAGLELMNAAVAVNAARMLFPDNRRTRILALAPGPDIAPHMIMVNGMSHMIRQFGAEGSRFCIGAQGLDVKSLLDELLQCEKDETPVTLMGASFGFVHLFDQMEESGRRFALPDGSRLMDAGGYKGRSRELERDEFVERACASLGLPPERVVNLLGMTELASQIYDGTLARSIRGPVDSAAMGMKEAPHWVRTRIVDPTSLASGFVATPRSGECRASDGRSERRHRPMARERRWGWLRNTPAGQRLRTAWMLAQRGRVRPIALEFDYIRFAVIVRADSNGWRFSKLSLRRTRYEPTFSFRILLCRRIHAFSGGGLRAGPGEIARQSS